MSDPFAPVVVRSPLWSIVGASAVFMVGCGAVALALTHDLRVTGLRVIWLAVVVGVVGYGVLVELRTRTVFGPEGIRTRRIKAETVVRWDDIVAVEVVQRYKRRPALKLFLARDLSTLLLDTGRADPESLFDLVRARAGLQETGKASPQVSRGRPFVKSPGWPEAPLLLRPSRWPLLWMIPLALVLIGGVAGLAAGSTESPALLFLLPVAPCLLVLSFRLVRGRTAVDEEGITNRLLKPPKMFYWDQIRHINVKPTLFGRVVEVGTTSRRFTLAAPRQGLLARKRDFDQRVGQLQTAAGIPRLSVRNPPDVVRTVYAGLLSLALAGSLALWAPWDESWWPGSNQIISLPKACDTVSAPTLNGLLSRNGSVMATGIQTSDVANDNDRYDQFRSCAWVQSGAGPGQLNWTRSLQVFLSLERHQFGGPSASSQAQDVLHRDCRECSPRGRYWVKIRPPQTDLLLRVANVVVEVYYQADDRTDALAQAQALAQTIAAQIRPPTHHCALRLTHPDTFVRTYTGAPAGCGRPVPRGKPCGVQAHQPLSPT